MPSQTVPMTVLMVIPRTNLDAKLVNVQVSVLGFREDKRFEIPGHTVKTELKEKLLQSEHIALIMLQGCTMLGSLSKPRRRLQRECRQTKG